MKSRIAFFIILGTILGAGSATAQNEFGIGVIVGEPTGISVKKWVNRRNAIDGAIAWSFSGVDAIQVHADYLYHRTYWFSDNEFDGQIPIYFGIGGRLRIVDDAPGRDRADQIGVRFPIGLGWTLREAPVEFFVELVPILDLAPDTDFDLNGALGARFYFGQ